MQSSSSIGALLFVYGTLRRGSDRAEAARLEREAQWLGSATTRGVLFRVSWYPALVAGLAGTVTGDVYRLRDARRSLEWLDAFEGCGADNPPPHDYRRVLLPVLLGGRTRPASVYAWNKPVTGLARIGSGDWLSA